MGTMLMSEAKVFEKQNGVWLPKQDQPESEPQPEYPVAEGWSFSCCGDDIREAANNNALIKGALELLYCAWDMRYGRGVTPDDQKALRDRIDELAVEFVGGVPDGMEVFT